jgi:hypothetical protein
VLTKDKLFDQDFRGDSDDFMFKDRQEFISIIYVNAVAIAGGFFTSFSAFHRLPSGVKPSLPAIFKNF